MPGDPVSHYVINNPTNVIRLSRLLVHVKVPYSYFHNRRQVFVINTKLG